LGREVRLRLLAHQVESLTRVGTAVSLGCIPWQNLELVRSLARHHEAAPEPARQRGDGLPIVALQVRASEADALVARVLKAQPFGVVFAELEGQPFVTLLCEQTSFGLMSGVDEKWAIHLFKDRRRAADGGHALLVTGLPDSPDAKDVFGLIELTTRDAPPVGRGSAPASPSRLRPGRKRKR
jgi:hypothetical protein